MAHHHNQEKKDNYFHIKFFVKIGNFRFLARQETTYVTWVSGNGCSSAKNTMP